MKHITMKMWEEAGSFDRVAVPGDIVDEEIVEEMMNNVPPLYYHSSYRQCGEPANHCKVPERDWYAPTYTTFKKNTDGVWVYVGECFKGESKHQSNTPPVIKAENVVAVHPEFKSYDKDSVRTTTISVDVLNVILKNAGSDLVIYKRSEEDSPCKMSSFSNQNVPHQVIAGSILGIRIVHWEWDESGEFVEIIYKKG